jgi:hypothetical protein
MRIVALIAWAGMLAASAPLAIAGDTAQEPTLAQPPIATSPAAPVDDARRYPMRLGNEGAMEATSHPRTSHAWFSIVDQRGTIDVDDVSLHEVLEGIGRAIGATVKLDGPGRDRIRAHIGPAHLRDLLMSLLDRVPYDYLLIGSDVGVGSITRIVVLQRANTSSPTTEPAMPLHNLSTQTETRTEPATPDSAPARDEAFMRTFGACIAQGCDAS